MFQRSKRLLAGAAIHCVLLVPSGWAQSVTGTYSWSFDSLDGRVNETFAPVTIVGTDRQLFFDFSDDVPFVDPAATRSSIRTTGLVDLDSRSLGAASNAQAIVNAYDPNTPNLQPLNIVTSVSAGVAFSDVIRIQSTSAGVGAVLEPRFRAPVISGEMRVPDGLAFGGGTAVFRYAMEITHLPDPGQLPMVFPGFVVEHIIGGGNGETYWNASGLQDLPFAPGQVALLTGQQYRMSVNLYTSVQLLPEYEPPEAPPEVTAKSLFNNTLRWNGIGSFLHDGQPVDDVVVLSAAGFDWVSPVPEPEQAVMLAAGLVLVLASRRLRRHPC